ncbi:hypothetical protein FS837_005078, partial [Tulasnella sp. UAMH 9824]
MYFTSTNRPTEPPPSPAQEQDDDPPAYLSPTLTATSTSASSSLPITPVTPHLGRFSTGRSYQPSLPGHREDDESQNVGLSSDPQFAFRPPSEPVSATLSLLARPGSTTSGSSAPSSSGTGLATQWVSQSTHSSNSYVDSKKAGLSVPSIHGSSSKIAEGFTSALSGLEKPVGLFDEVRRVDVQETVQAVEYSNDGDVEDSPYPEVRASVSNFDDSDMPCLTFRM